VPTDAQTSDPTADADRFPLLTERETAQNLCIAGIDRLSVSFPCEDFDRRPESWNQVTQKMVGTPNESASYGCSISLGKDQPSVYVGVQHQKAGHGAWGKIEFNPARVVDPQGWKLAPVSTVRASLEKAVEKALELVAPGVPSVDEMHVKRLDVARDFETEHSEFYVRGLAPVHRPWARRNLVHFDPGRKGAQTLMVGSGAGVVRLYDKFAETEGKAPAGTLRWEAECKSDWVTKYGDITTFADVNEERVAELARNRWEWSAMGTDVGAIERVVEKAQRSGMSQRELLSFLGYVTLLANGSGQVAHRNTATKYRKMSKELGVSIGELEVSSAQFLGRLDWETGREHLHAA
jgi:hypothetical protein